MQVYTLVSLKETTEDKEYTHNVLISCKRDELEEYIDALLLTFRDEVTKVILDDFGYVYKIEVDYGEILLEIEDFKEIPQEYVDILKRFGNIPDVTPSEKSLEKAKELKAKELNEKTYLVEVTEVNGEYEYSDKCLISCDPEDLEITLKALIVFWRGNATRILDNSSVYTENKTLYNLYFKIEMDFCHILLSSFKEVPTSDIQILSRYLYNVTPEEEKIEKTKKFIAGEYSFDHEIEGVELYDDEDEEEE